MKLDKTDITILEKINNYLTVSFKGEKGAEACNISVSTFYRKLKKISHLFKPAKFNINFYKMNYIPFLFIWDYPEGKIRFDPEITFSYSPKCVHVQSIQTTDKIILVGYFKHLENLVDFEKTLREKGFNPQYTKIESNDNYESFDLLEIIETKGE